MIRILFCQPIFLASEKLKEKNFNSIKSLKYIIEYLPRDYEIIFKLEGWSFKDKFWREFEELVSSLPIQIEYKRLEHNYGKAYIINKIVREHTDDFNYILTCDSDIIFLENQHYIERLVESMEKFPTEKRGIISLNQKICTFHKYQFMKNSFIYDGLYSKEELKKGPGIAGGCFFIPNERWKIIGGYDLRGIRFGDDGNLFSKNLISGAENYMFSTLSVIHPRDFPDENFRKWKRKEMSIKRGIMGKEELEELSKKSIEELWNHE